MTRELQPKFIKRYLKLGITSFLAWHGWESAQTCWQHSKQNLQRTRGCPDEVAIQVSQWCWKWNSFINPCFLSISCISHHFVRRQSTQTGRPVCLWIISAATLWFHKSRHRVQSFIPLSSEPNTLAVELNSATVGLKHYKRHRRYLNSPLCTSRDLFAPYAFSEIPQVNYNNLK